MIMIMILIICKLVGIINENDSHMQQLNEFFIEFFIEFF